jgi:hypothetical protein
MRRMQANSAIHVKKLIVSGMMFVAGVFAHNFCVSFGHFRKYRRLCYQNIFLCQAVLARCVSGAEVPRNFLDFL